VERPSVHVARILGMAGVAVCTLGLVAAQIRAGIRLDASLFGVLFAAWPYAPFVAALAMLAPAGASIARSVAMVLVSLLAMIAYADLALSDRPGSTAGLLFLWMPIWQMLGLGLAIAVATTIEQRASRRR
jgi:hypothetical protein